MPRLLVFGTFDHLHPGHKFLIAEALKRGNLSIVIARDTHVKEIKGRLPDQNETVRLKAVQEAFPDAHSLLGDPHDYLAPIREVKPDLILLGYDQTLPPGIEVTDFPCPIERLPAFEPEKWKSSLHRKGI
ncbi:MAG TPA: adenylyltransferase/cytidyltransferase family protein [Candidatus Peribacterales bacterium]|nr:adenylyltransferase/cytidyltransferase family protein [Candidatus Peribacterales bacterium]